MRAKGISYDTGFVHPAGTSRRHFDPDVVRRELAVIRDDLHCTAVRVMGGDPERLELAAEYADLGLEVWFSPYPLSATAEEMLALFADCAERAERLREPAGQIGARVNDFLGTALAVVRERFAGKVTYAAIHLERVDWEPFDIVGMDLYRSAEVADRFGQGVRALVEQGRPVAVLEFGAATFRGAGERGARGLEIVEYAGDTGLPLRLDGVYVRDEAGQAAYVRDLLEIFDEAGVEAAFVFTFALHDFPHRPRRRRTRRPRPGQLRRRQGAPRRPRRHLPRPAVGAQGRLRRAGRPLRPLTRPFDTGCER